MFPILFVGPFAEIRNKVRRAAHSAGLAYCFEDKAAVAVVHFARGLAGYVAMARECGSIARLNTDCTYLILAVVV